MQGAICPHCEERREREREREQAERQRAQEEAAAAARNAIAAEKANSGLAWKTALTVFLPFVGAYFLLNPLVSKGYRVFAIIWCSLLSLSVATSGTGSDVLMTLLTMAFCLGPTAVYLYRCHETLLRENRTRGLLAIGAFVLFFLVCCIMALV